MTVEIICGDISALPSSDHATELLPLTDEASRRAYSFQWNMWFAAEKPKHED